MTPAPFRVLLLDPNFVTRIALTSRLEATGLMVRAEKSISTAARAATASNWDLILSSASLALADLEAFLETLRMTECRACLAIVVEGDNDPRRQLAERFSARLLSHPVRPQLLTQMLSAPATSAPAPTDPFFRAAEGA